MPLLHLRVKGVRANSPTRYAYHLSNGESVEHITVQPEERAKMIHVYRDGVITQGDERRAASRSPSPHHKRHPHAAPEDYGSII